MLPRANRERSKRDIAKLKLSPRSAEIQRLVGRSLRAAVDMAKLGEQTITIDCDVLQGDGGTRTASVTGGFVALSPGLPEAGGGGRAGRESHPALRHRRCLPASSEEQPLCWICSTARTAVPRWT